MTHRFSLQPDAMTGGLLRRILSRVPLIDEDYNLFQNPVGRG